MEDPSPEKAKALALDLMPQEKLESALADPWIEERIKSNVLDWHRYSATTDKMPKLLIRDRRIVHGLPSSEEDFIRVLEQELGL